MFVWSICRKTHYKSTKHENQLIERCNTERYGYTQLEPGRRGCNAWVQSVRHQFAPTVQETPAACWGSSRECCHGWTWHSTQRRLDRTIRKQRVDDWWQRRQQTTQFAHKCVIQSDLNEHVCVQNINIVKSTTKVTRKNCEDNHADESELKNTQFP